MRYFVCHVLLIISICNTDILARDIEHFTTADGLAHNHVSAFCQDMYGYLWIGTWDGLSRFDGHTFTNYKYKTKDPSTIHSDQVLQITEAPDGNLWVLTRQGLSRYDRQNGIFTRFENIASEKENIPKRKIRQIVFDNHNRIWGFCHEGLFVFDQETGKIHRAAISDVYIKHGYMLRTEKGLWLASTKGLFLFGFDYLSTNKNVKKSEAIKSLSFDDENINAISMLTKLSTGLLMAKIDKTGLLVIDPETGICKIPDTGVASEWEDINYISEIMPGEVWIGTNNSGILIFDLALGKFVANSMIEENIGNQNVYSIFRDNQENIWTGTLNGALRYKLPLLKFDSWKFDPVPNNIGNPNRIFALVVDTANKHLWVGAKGGGLKMVNLANNDIRVITPPVLHNNPSGSKNASCLFLLNNDELLVGYNNMLWLYNNRSGLFTEFKPVSRYARTIFRDRDKRLWITDLDSLTIAEERAGKYVFRSMHHSAFLDKANYMGCIHQDKNGQMWMGSGFGLLKFNETQPDKSLVFAPPGSGPDRHVFAICESQDGLLWLGTNRNGIYAFDPEMEDFVSHYCDTSGLINNSVYAIVEDEKNNLWISTQSGISRFDPSRVEFTNFSKADGLPFFEFNSGAFFKANTGKIYFGGEGGLIAFYPGSFIQTAAEIPFSIHGIKSKKGIVPLLYPIRSDTKFSLSNAENSLEISFGHFDLRTSKERNYRYKLLGLNTGWIEVPVNYRLASFYNLDPG
ncbi:MAG: two-component regulator propeller domain-containing protein, partial [Bacteroidota bacterium]|nr:two-component regulator propeller domain-containing protein [Bacteroidota bacterium]